MPGVKKEDISVELNESHLLVSAPTEDIDYVTSMTFCRPVRYDEVETAYECNLVKITVPFKNGAQEAAMAKFPEQTGFSVRTLPQPGK
jgi:HSP20 family molecular chaperone IbpA